MDTKRKNQSPGELEFVVAVMILWIFLTAVAIGTAYLDRHVLETWVAYGLIAPAMFCIMSVAGILYLKFRKIL